MAANDDLLDKSISHSIYLTRHSTSVANKVLAMLGRVDEDIVSQIATFSEGGRDRDRWTKAQLSEILTEIRRINSEVYALVSGEVITSMESLAVYESEFSIRMLDSVIPVDVNFVTPAEKQIVAAVMARPFQGRTLSEWLKTIEESQASRITDSVRIGFIEGETILQMQTRIRGTRALKFKDGILEIGRRGASALVRTATTHTASVARELTYKENSSVVKGIRWVSALDSRTSAVCRGRDGKVYEPGKGARPPAHVNCRSTTTPITKSWKEMGIDLNEAPESTRASLSGQVPKGETYNSWLKKQPAQFQDDVLGKSKGALFRRGDMPLDKFTDRAGNELTLKELKIKDSAAFEKANVIL